MKPLPEWIITRIDGKIAAISTDYRLFAAVAGKIARMPADRISEISCTRISTEELFALAARTTGEDLALFGTKFQNMVWRKLFSLTHPEAGEAGKRLMSYTEFAQYCGCPEGVRAVAHAVAMNPILVVIPCHLIIPKETMDRIHETEKEAEASLFGKDGLRLDTSLHFGDYRLGPEMKRRLIGIEFNSGNPPSPQTLQ